MRTARAAAGALAFLTRVPLGRRLTLDAADVGAGAVFFPPVGAAVGAAVAATLVLLDGPLGALLAAAVALAAGTMLTGAMHLDALADTADSLGAATRERALEIMRDHATGAYGTTAITLDLLIKTGALAELAAGAGWRGIVVASTISRAVPLALASSLPYAREAVPGAGRLLTDLLTHRGAAAGIVLAGLISILLLGNAAVPLLAVAAATALLLDRWSRRRLGGVTGDTLGASIEVSETLALVVAAATL
jgi:adenosylcobinamide-GDP ribazoletransferase